MKFAANLSCMFAELPFMDRFAAAKEAGFDAVEINSPYDFPAQELRHALLRYDLTFTLITSPPPNWAGGERGFAAVPGLEKRFQTDFERCLRYADLLRPRHIHIIAGRAKGTVARATLIRNLTWACDRAQGRSLVIQPMSASEQPGYFLDSFWTANDIIAEVDRPNLGLLFDAFQAQMMSENLMACWQAHGHRARHIQIAGAPLRTEPDDETVDWPGFFAAVGASPYAGFIGAEYTPRTTTQNGLGWFAPYRR